MPLQVLPTASHWALLKFKHMPRRAARRAVDSQPTGYMNLEVANTQPTNLAFARRRMIGSINHLSEAVSRPKRLRSSSMAPAGTLPTFRASSWPSELQNPSNSHPEDLRKGCSLKPKASRNQSFVDQEEIPERRKATTSKPADIRLKSRVAHLFFNVFH